MLRPVKMALTALLLGSLVACGGSGEKYTLLGEVLVLEQEGVLSLGDGECSSVNVLPGGDLTITMANGDELETQLPRGRVTPEGNCSFQFTVDVPDSDRYAFTYGNRTVVREKRTIGTTIPAGLEHKDAATGDWWVTISFTD